MVTHRTLTAEVLPVQGKMTISGRDMFSPTTLTRTTTGGPGGGGSEGP